MDMKVYYIKHSDMGRFCGEFLGLAFWGISKPKQEPIYYPDKEEAKNDLIILKQNNPEAHVDCFIEEHNEG